MPVDRISERIGIFLLRRERMNELVVINRTRKQTLATHCRVAQTLWTRFRGLMGVRFLKEGEGLLLRGEQAIHTFGMRISIDVAYLDKQGIVLRLMHAMPPARLGPVIWRAHDVIELPAGTFRRTQTQEGDQLDTSLTNLGQ